MNRLLLVAAAIAAIAIGIVAVAGAGAQEGSGGGGTRLDNWVAKVAERLGITEEDLTGAMQGAQVDLIDERVASGDLTQEQADALKARIEEQGVLVPRFGRQAGDRLRCAAAKVTLNAAAAVLGMENDALIEEMRPGKTLAQVAESHGMSVEDFKAALLDQENENLDAKVAAGGLTQAQADKLYKAFEKHIDQIVDHAVDPGHGPCRPRHDGPPAGGAPAPDASMQ